MAQWEKHGGSHSNDGPFLANICGSSCYALRERLQKTAATESLILNYVDIQRMGTQTEKLSMGSRIHNSNDCL